MSPLGEDVREGFPLVFVTKIYIDGIIAGPTDWGGVAFPISL